ncbi:hypothetical protein NPIL_240581 [Nephila pilipes]|uniref:Uncharacterized protein n=1 Tax=Nephila pilipes TaxID=299642 RepID=A0A8X6QIU8_NEPPI|nr:hypothetical protein NPIL_240581 [Nephila pilipes]
MANVSTASNFGIQNKAQILRVPVHQKRQTIHEKFWLQKVYTSIRVLLTLLSRLDMSTPDFQMTISSANKPILTPSRDNLFNTTQGQGEEGCTQNKALRKSLSQLKTSRHEIT